VTRAQPIVFGPAGHPLLGFYHPPAPGAVRAPAVVLCNPLGYEAMSAHRTLRHLAERLAASGLPALRFDYHGTGDSSGQSREPARIAAWVGDIRSAVRELRERSGAARVALFGVRFGASLATLAAAGEKDVDALVLWAPVVSGRARVRELRAFRMLKDPKARRDDGGEEIGGYLFSRETLADMSAIELLERTDRGVARVLVLPRGETPAPDEADLVAHWKTAGADASVAPVSGYASMMRDDPFFSVVPFATLDAIVAWLAQDAATAGPEPPPAKPASTVLHVAGPPGQPALRETAMLFGDDQRLFGVVTEPDVPDAPVAPDRPAIVLLNVGADSHVGPHRMSVEHARELAAMGYVTFRFDVAGLGESLVGPGGRENRLYDLASVDDLKSAMTALGAARGVKRFVLVGLCSGAFLAYHAAATDPRVVGQVLLNMFAFEWKEGDPVAPAPRKTYLSSRFYARSLFDRRVWRRALRGEVDVRGIAAVVAERLWDQGLLTAHELGSRVLGRRARTPVERTFHALSDRGVQSLMVFSDKDGGLDMIARYLGTDARRMARRHEFSIQIASEVDHTFASIASQEHLRRAVARFVTEHFG
jgi:alpha-beta hydrolase superfamily lysophospholipase